MKDDLGLAPLIALDLDEFLGSLILKEVGDSGCKQVPERPCTWSDQLPSL